MSRIRFIPYLTLPWFSWIFLRQISNTHVLPQDTQGLRQTHGDLSTVYDDFSPLESLKQFTDAPIKVLIKHGFEIRTKILSSVQTKCTIDHG